MTGTMTYEFEQTPLGEVDRLREKLQAAQNIINQQDAEIKRLRGELESETAWANEYHAEWQKALAEIENLTPPAALGYVTGVYAEQTNRVHCLRRGKR